MAFLTFDDGPDARWTSRVLDELAAVGARATFFVMAGRAHRQPELVARMRDEGHEVGLHCLRHARHTESTRGEIECDTDSALGLLERLGVRPRRWRPPWGARADWTSDVASSRGLRLAGWTLDPEDWSGLTAKRMLEHASEALSPDSVVLLHDGLGPGARRDGCTETVALIAPLARRLRALETTLRPLGEWRVPLQ